MSEDLVKKIKFRSDDSEYTIRDKNTYRSLSAEQKSLLESTCTYNGSLIKTDEIFLTDSGRFIKYYINQLPAAVFIYNLDYVGFNTVYGSETIGYFKDLVLLTGVEPWVGSKVFYSETKGATWVLADTTEAGVNTSYNFYCNSKIALSIGISDSLIHGTFSLDGKKWYNLEEQVAPQVMSNNYTILIFKDKIYIIDHAGWYIVSDGTISEENDHAIIWSEKKVLPSITSIQKITANLDNIYIFGDNKVFKSEDGENWSTGTNSNYYGTIVAAGHKIFCETNDSGFYHGTSTDGITFTRISGALIDGGNNRSTYFYCNGTYIVGLNDNYRESDNGIDWESVKSLYNSDIDRGVRCFGNNGSTRSVAVGDTYLACLGAGIDGGGWSSSVAYAQLNTDFGYEVDHYEYLSYMIGATDSEDGLGGTVPPPLTGDQEKFLKGDGTWAEVQGGSQPEYNKKTESIIF